MDEKHLQDIIKNNEYNSQEQILRLLNISSIENVKFAAEDQFPNGIFVDFTILKDQKVFALIETKGSNIAVTEFIRGFGQITEYSHFVKSNYSIKNYDLREAKIVYLLPHDLILNSHYNIGDFEFPDNCILMEYNEFNQSFHIVPKGELDKIRDIERKDLKLLCTYYVRDTRIFEIYIGLKYAEILSLYGNDRIDRVKAEDFLRQLDVPDNRNWRNVFISLSSLGLIDSKNIPTVTGTIYSRLSYEEFAYEVYQSYISSYFSEIFRAIKEIKIVSPYVTLDALKENIDNHYGGKEVLFLTESNKRYLSSWLNIMRDDYGCIDFEPKKNEKDITIVYDPSELNKNAFCSRVREHSIAYPYLDKFNDLVSRR